MFVIIFMLGGTLPFNLHLYFTYLYIKSPSRSFLGFKGWRLPLRLPPSFTRIHIYAITPTEIWSWPEESEKQEAKRCLLSLLLIMSLLFLSCWTFPGIGNSVSLGFGTSLSDHCNSEVNTDLNANTGVLTELQQL